MITTRTTALTLAIVAALIAGLWPAAGRAAAEGLRLKESIRVTGDVITIGDLFRNAGAAAGTALFRSPAPGRNGVISAGRLRLTLRGHGLHWRNPYGIGEIIIARRGRLVEPELVKSAIIEHVAGILGADAADNEFDVSFSNKLAPLYVAADQEPSVGILHINYDPLDGSFRAIVTAPAGEPKARRQVYSGRAIEVASVPVPVRPLARGETISAGDLELRRLPKRRLGTRVLTDSGDLVGLATRRNLRPGRPISQRDVERPKIVKRNTLVTVTYETAGLTVSARGRALDDGAKGDIVDVLNVKSNRKIQAVVVAEGAVAVAAGTTASIRIGGGRRGRAPRRAPAKTQN